jgi:hypothetical protein
VDEKSDGVSLRQYVDGRFEAQDKAVAAALAAQEKAVTAALAAADRAVAKAETATDKRFENSNEWRNTVETLQRTYMPRTEADQLLKALSEKIDELTARVNSRDDRGRGLSQGWMMLVGAVGLIATVVGLVAFFSK